MDLEQVKTIANIKEYTQCNSSLVAQVIIQAAIEFFMVNCTDEKSKMNTKKLQERRILGLVLQLKDETKINSDIARALKNWFLSPLHGRRMGLEFQNPLDEDYSPKVISPREEVSKILDYLRDQ